MNRSSLLWGLALSVAGVAVAHAGCPKLVTDAAAKVFPRATLTGCTAEREHGHDQFEAKLKRADGSTAELDIAPDGKILQIEEPIAIADVPVVVIKAFAAQYPKATASRAEKQTADGAVSYELAFTVGKARKEATFDSTGKLVGEE